MSVVTAVLRGNPTTPHLKSLSAAIGGGVMDLRNDWLGKASILMFEIAGDDFKRNAALLRKLLRWADKEGVEVDLYETDDVLPPPGERPDPQPRELVMNAIGTGFVVGRQIAASPMG